jgi:hypothetical protein
VIDMLVAPWGTGRLEYLVTRVGSGSRIGPKIQTDGSTRFGRLDSVLYRCRVNVFVVVVVVVFVVSAVLAESLPPNWLTNRYPAPVPGRTAWRQVLF